MPALDPQLEAKFQETVSRGVFENAIEQVCEKLDKDEKLDAQQHEALMEKVIAVNEKTREIVRCHMDGLGKKLFWAVVFGFAAFSVIFTLGQWYFKTKYGMIF